MDENLMGYPTAQLLEKFGIGSHKPGSGSAAALQGMLSAQLIRTVAELTIKKKSYSDWHQELLIINIEIKDRIYPALEKLFQADSEQFDIAIKLRTARDEERNPEVKKQLEAKAIQELMPSTEMPIKIAELCKELADFSVFVFDHGYKAVRGDSAVALHGAVSAIGGCLSIIDLNLLSFKRNEWTDSIRKERDKLRSQYVDLSSIAKEKLEALAKESDEINLCYSELHSFLSETLDESKLSYYEIEEIAKKLQNTIWKHRSIIWKKNVPVDHIQILDPKEILEVLGYQVNQFPMLGQDRNQGTVYEVAGIIDKQNKTVSISEKFGPEVRKFTIAHELGHLIFHKKQVLHRDMALDGSLSTTSRPLEEVQADKFAAYFLMPRNQVLSVFQEIFQMEKFVVNQDTAFAFNLGTTSRFRAKCKDLRGLSRFVASFKPKSFNSLEKIFGVSTEAMAIRLEELELVEF